MGLKTFTKILGVTAIALPLMVGSVANAKKNKKEKECAAKAGVLTGIDPKMKSKKNSKKAQKYMDEYSKCMRGGSGGGMPSIPKIPKF